jgi:O-antigen/teichoic acid export membrane protein
MGNVGIYSLGFKIANTIRVFLITSVNLALQPMIFKMMNDPANKRFYSKVMTYFSFGLMFFVLFFSIYASEIVKVISSKMDYWQAYKIVPVLSLSMLFSMLRDVAYTGLNISKRTRIIAFLIFLAALLNILLNQIFIPRWSFYGAAIATTLSQIIFFGSVLYFAQRYYPIPYELNKIILMVVTGIVLYFIGLLFDPLPLVFRLPLKFLLIVVFPFILFLFHFYEPVELVRMRQIWDKWHNPGNWGKNLSKIKFN